MRTWGTRASIAGACLFALLAGAGAVFAGDWWGEHHVVGAARSVPDQVTVTATRTVQASELVPQPYAVSNPQPATTVTVPGPTVTRTVPGPTVTTTVPGPTVTQTVPAPSPSVPVPTPSPSAGPPHRGGGG